MVIGARHIGQPRRLPAIQGAAKKNDPTHKM